MSCEAAGGWGARVVCQEDPGSQLAQGHDVEGVLGVFPGATGTESLGSWTCNLRG